MTLASPLGGGGLGPSNKAAAPRALLLIAVAVIIGLVLLWKGVDTTPGTESSAEVAVDNSLGAVSTSSEEPNDGQIADDPVPTIAPVLTTTTTTTTTPPPTRPPNQVRVLVANGSGVARGASNITGILNPSGYTTLAPANATPTDTSGIYYRPSYSSDARGIMEIVAPGNPDLISPLPSGGLDVPENALDRVADANVVVILGSDFRIINR